MKDFSFWEEYEGSSEGSGRSEKIWLQNPDTGQIGLFKFKKDIKKRLFWRGGIALQSRMVKTICI